MREHKENLRDFISRYDKPILAPSRTLSLRPHLKTKKIMGQQCYDFKSWRPLLPSEVDSDSFEAGLAAASSVLVSPNVTYKFRLANLSAFSSDIGGVLAWAFAFDPSAITEFTTLSSLFNEVRIVQAKLTLINHNPHGDSAAAPVLKPGLVCGTDIGLAGTTPASAAAVYENPDSIIIPLGSDLPHYLHSQRFDNDFALTVAPIPGPYAGCYGQFQGYQSTCSVSTKYLECLFEGIYEFTSRT